MEIAKHTDPVAIVEALMSSLFRRVFSNQEIRDLVGLKNIHELANPTGLPAWYLWHQKAKGAYFLQFMDATKENLQTINYNMLLRYFPHPAEALFCSFTREEQKTRQSPCFDQTGTPIFGSLDFWETSLFAIGLINLEISLESVPLKLTWQGPFSQEEEIQTWEQGHHLADALVLGLGLYTETDCHMASVIKNQSFDQNEQTKILPDWACLTVDFRPNSNTIELNPNEKLISYATKANPKGRYINPKWWHLAHKHFHCEDDHCHCYA